jgi:hypothetical protein
VLHGRFNVYNTLGIDAFNVSSRRKRMFDKLFSKKKPAIQATAWPFDAPQNEAVITSKQIVAGAENILYVTHDAEDGSWQFLPEGNISENDAAIVGLGQIAKLDPTVLTLWDLPEGWSASRASAKAPWLRTASEPNGNA